MTEPRQPSSNPYLAKPVLEWLRERESDTLSGMKFREAADEIERLTAIVERNKTSAVHRLHNLCDGIAEHAAESPFSREAWEEADAVAAEQGCRLAEAARLLRLAEEDTLTGLTESDGIQWLTDVRRWLAGASSETSAKESVE